MDRYVIREPRNGGEHPEGNQMIAFSATSSTGNNITMPENVYYGAYGGEVQNTNVQQLGRHRLVTPHVQTYSLNVIPTQGQVSSIDPRYLATYAENNAAYYADMNAAYPDNNAAYPDSNAAYPDNNAAYAQTMQRCNKPSTTVVNTFGSDYQNRNFIGTVTNNRNFNKTQASINNFNRPDANMNNKFNRVQTNNRNLISGQVNNANRAQENNLNFNEANINKMQTNNHSFNRAEANKNFNRAPMNYQNFNGAKENNPNFKGGPDNNQNIREADVKNQHFKGAERNVHKLYVPQTTSSVVSKKQTEIDLLKHELQNQVKTRADKLKELQKSGTRVFSGPVEKILKWHKSIQEIGVMVLYEIVGKCVNVRAGESCAKNLVVRDENGPAIQVVYYEIDFFLPELKPPCTVRVIGRMMPGTNRFQAFNVRLATGDDVATLPRRAAVAAHHVAKLAKEYGVEVLTLK